MVKILVIERICARNYLGQHTFFKQLHVKFWKLKFIKTILYAF